MATLAQFAAELKPWFPQIDPLAANVIVQRAYRDIRRSREWSFLKQTGAWFAPSIITGGTVSVTLFSNQVVFDATAAPQLQAVALTAAPAAPLTMRQFRVTGGPIYNITAWAYNSPSAGLGAATLDRPYAEPTLSGQSYMVYQPYVPAPAPDFKRWLSWVDPINNYRFRYRNLYWTQKEVDRRDPARQSYSIPIAVAAHDYVNNQQFNPPVVTPRFELWPHPVQQIGYVIEYMINGDAVTLTTPLPVQITDECIMARSRYYAHEVVANQPNVDVKVKAYHVTMRQQVQAEYADLLNRCRLDDNSIFDAIVINEESGPIWNGPLDAEYIQSHELFLIG